MVDTELLPSPRDTSIGYDMVDTTKTLKEKLEYGKQLIVQSSLTLLESEYLAPSDLQRLAATLLVVENSTIDSQDKAENLISQLASKYGVQTQPLPDIGGREWDSLTSSHKEPEVLASWR